MAIQEWSDDIIVADLADDPQFSDQISALTDKLADRPRNVVLNFGSVGFVNSSNIAKLLQMRKKMISSDYKLMLCDVNTQVWGILAVTGLDKIFEHTNDVATALASLQLSSV